jgi:hypothetical protein
VNYIPNYQYQVRVIIKGTLATKGKEWKGPWITGSENGSIMISVPSEEEALPGTKKFISPMRRPVWPAELPTAEAEAVAAGGGAGMGEGEPGAPPVVRRSATRTASRVHGFTYEPPTSASSRTTSGTKPANGGGDGADSGELTDVLDDNTAELTDTTADDTTIDESTYYDDEQTTAAGDAGDMANDATVAAEDNMDATTSSNGAPVAGLFAETGDGGDDALPEWDEDTSDSSAANEPSAAPAGKYMARGAGTKGGNGSTTTATSDAAGLDEGYTVRRRSY